MQRSRFVKALSFLLAFGVATVASAHDDREPRTPVKVDSFSSVASVHVSITPAATCAGTDGTYTLLHVTGKGPSTSTDARLGGIFHVDAYILDSPSSGLGVSIDNWKITDPSTGKVKAEGKGLATDLGPHPRAVSYGKLADGSHMVTNAFVTLPAPGSDVLTIEYGGHGTTEADRGVILSGNNRCVRTLLRAIDQ